MLWAMNDLSDIGADAAAPANAGNQLARETSPYLLRHADNPVHWRAWNPAALAEARDTGRPILLSIGYSACHWCHVMARECFDDQAIAAVMNEFFVNIKVDREERPDIDTIYQSALGLMGTQGGWPLTMFCTPDAKPFWGGTYFPPTPAFGRPGFADIARRIAEIYANEADHVARNAGVILEGLAGLSNPPSGPNLDANDFAELAGQLADGFDGMHGGFHGAPKFPMVPSLRLAWQLAHGSTAGDTSRAQLTKQVLHTADRMAMGGIYDHLGGGFARYSVDERWLVPHFEKMLYDNAQLIELYAMLWRRTGSDLYAQRVAETIDWAVAEMRHEGGAFYAALDADSEGVEGKFYVWRAAEIATLLGDDAAGFAAAYDVTEGGNWDGVTILNRLAAPNLAEPASEAALARARDILTAHRATRVAPRRDDKILTDWNGLMISGLTEAALAFDRPDWLDLATGAFHFLAENASDGDRLYHSWQAGRARLDGLLEDYANMIHAATRLHEATGDLDYLADARRWAATVETHFAAAEGAYHQSSDLADDVISRTRSCTDQPNPSGNARLAEGLVRLFYLTGEAEFRTRAEAIIAVFAHEARGNAIGLASLVGAADLLARAVQVVIVGGDTSGGDTSGVDDLRTAAFHAPEPNRIVIPVSGGAAALGPDHPAAGKTATGGKATAYVCRGQTCTAPITQAPELARELAED